MKSQIVLAFALLFSINVFAGDTTSVKTHDKVVIKTDPSKGVTEYPSKVEFPDSGSRFRKIYMYLEFGCAPGLKCGEWDYGNHVYLKKNGIRYEISRFITPYGFYWNSGMNWKHGWYYDLTDYALLLNDSAEVIYQHSGYESNTDRGWTVTMDFKFIEGTPARIPIGIQTMYQLSAPYGNANNPFSNVVTEKSFTMPDSANMVSFKTIQTGHGMDQQENCAEFCNKQRTILLDNQVLAKKQVWRDDCGWNSLFPQAGTWIYDRAGWCPGASVVPDDNFALLEPGSQHTYHIRMQDYTNTAGGSANYVLTSHAFFFKDNRMQVDAAIEEIIAPSKHYEYLRYNPVCGAPIIRVRNLGKDTLKRLVFDYGKLGGKVHNIWVPCNIPPFESGTVELEAVYNWNGAGNTFFATITKVNDVADGNTEDNTAYSEITRSPTHPNRIYIVFKSNNAPTENSYKLTDAKGKVLVQRSGFAANTIYRDTVNLENNICYNFEFSDAGPGLSSYPLNEDGLDWWANSGDGSGYIQLRNGNSNAMLKNFNSDFGTKHLYQFQTTFNMGVDDVQTDGLQVDVYPNPSNGKSNLHIETLNENSYSYTLYDINGRELYKSDEISGTFDTTIDGLSPGVYTIVFYQGTRLQTVRFIVQ